MWTSRALIAASWLALLALTACAAEERPAPPVAAPTTTLDIGAHACTYVTVEQASVALGAAPRKAASTTANDVSYCTYRTSDAKTDLVVKGGGGGVDGFDGELDLVENDLAAKRSPVPGISGGYLISGTELGAPVVLVGGLRGNHWFTVSLRVNAVTRPSLEQRAIVILTESIDRLSVS